MQLHFYGGARTVTGSNYLLEAGGLKVLIDCGLFQGSHFNDELNYEAFAYDPKSVDFVVLTHSHTDHVGRLPKLYKDGFRGVVWATEPTKGIINVTLYDTVEKIDDESRALGYEPLYTKREVDQVLTLVKGVKYNEAVPLNEAVTVTFHEVSHILGSAWVEVIVKENGQERRLAFSGDVGNPPTPLLNPIEYPENIDYLVIESAYGDRTHEDKEQRKEILHKVMIDTVKRKGVLMIPSFALERTQELLLEIDTLFEAGVLPKVPIFVDSPLAAKITEVYGRFASYFSPSAREILRDNDMLFQFPWLSIARDAGESKRINDIASPKIIIAGSGMSQGGRILHHESRYLPDPNSAILFVGYQVSGSLGRRIFDGQQEVTIFGQPVPVRSRIFAIGGYSAHADQGELMEFVRHAARGKSLKNVFTVQGEERSAAAFAEKIGKELNVHAEAPELAQSFTLT